MLAGAPAASPSGPRLPLPVTPVVAPLKLASSVSFNALTAAPLLTDSAWCTVSPTCTMLKSTGVVVFSCATAGVYTCPVSATLPLPTPASGAPVVPAPVDT